MSSGEKTIVVKGEYPEKAIEFAKKIVEETDKLSKKLAAPPPKKQTGMDVLKKSLTAAQKVFTGVTILNERPEGMSFEEYKRLRRDQRKALKRVI